MAKKMHTPEEKAHEDELQELYSSNSRNCCG